MTTTTGSIADKVWRAFPDMPKTLSGAALNDMVEDAKIDVQNYVGITISSNAIEEEYQPVITSLAKGQICSSMSGKGVGFDFNITEFKINKTGNAHENLARFYFADAASKFKRLPFSGFSFKKANG